MKLLRLFAILGSDDQTTSGVLYKAVQDALGCAECTSNIGLGVLHVCLCKCLCFMCVGGCQHSQVARSSAC